MLIEINNDIIQSLTKTEYEIIKFINKNEDRLSALSIVDIAFDTYSSPATVSRAIRKCGVNGFNELRYRLTSKNKDDEIHNMGEIINKSFVEARQVVDRISVSNVLNIINCLVDAKRIYVLARGLTEYVGQEFTLKLQLLGCNVIFIDDPNIMQIKTKQLSDNDVVFIFSLNGETYELVESAKNGNLCGAKVITCCCSETSSLLEYSHYNLIGFKHNHVSIKKFEVSSRVSLSMMSRIIIDYMAAHLDL
ncbi:MAG: MurR/RpiR family transcriptional regulator [Terrisporobacter sp.]|uniref:MurR/RpiR family transcriptional regulator n=1 Tax=Terrisporobacter sp. TaxID=1965305 RepID=UPI002FC7A36B